MHWVSIIGLTIGSLIALLPIAFIAYVNIGGIRHAVKHASRGKIHSLAATSPFACAADTDCPAGYVCVNGSCVPGAA